jgi:hypothetical protein
MASKIYEGMDSEEWREAWFEAVAAKGHVLKDYDDEPGRIDLFVTSGGIHNGPGCTKCGWTTCMHCDWKADNIPACTEEPRQ